MGSRGNYKNNRHSTTVEDISIAQYKALCLLASGKSNEEVAREAGVSTRTIERWKKDPRFEKHLREASAKMFDCAIAELCSSAVETAKELRQIILDEDTPKRVKVSAIQVLLSTAARAKESLLEERLEKLEAALDGNPDQSED